jgi:hypothetical protein
MLLRLLNLLTLSARQNHSALHQELNTLLSITINMVRNYLTIHTVSEGTSIT